MHGVGCGDGAPGSVARWDGFAAAPQTRRSGSQVVVRDAAESDCSVHERSFGHDLIRLVWQDPCYSFPLSAGDVPCARL